MFPLYCSTIHPMIRRRMITFVWLLSCMLAFASPQQQKARSAAQKADQAKQLQLLTNILETQYCSSSNLVLTLRLLFTNTGIEPILLQKKSSVISRFMVSRSYRKAREKNYVMDARENLDWKAAGFVLDSAPELSLFVTLKPGESYVAERKLHISVFESNDGLPVGKYFLQVRVPTWYYPPAAAEEVRERWKDEGFLWTQTLTSAPMPFEVERGRPASPCSSP